MVPAVLTNSRNTRLDIDSGRTCPRRAGKYNRRHFIDICAGN
jgi:hypothetical protein